MSDYFAARRLILSILVPLCLVAAFLSGCQDEAKGTKAQMTRQSAVIDGNAASGKPGAQAPASGPRMTFEQTTHDFGDVVPETRYKTEFRFTNTGTAPLKIVNVRPCCGTVIKGVEDGQVYAPGRGGVVELEFPAGSLPGTFARSVYITTNDPTQQIVTLSFRAEIIKQISCEPTSLRLFLRRENGGAGDLTVKSLTGQPFSITSFRSTGDSVTAQFDPAVKDTQFVLKLTADTEKLNQHPRGRVEIQMNHPGCKVAYVDYDVLPEFTISPPQLIAFNLKPGEPAQKEIWILGNYDNDFDIESITSKNGLLKVVDKEKVKLAPGLVVGMAPGQGEPDRPGDEHYQYRVKVEVVPPQDRTPISDTLLVAIKGGDTLTVDYRGFYAPGK